MGDMKYASKFISNFLSITGKSSKCVKILKNYASVLEKVFYFLYQTRIILGGSLIDGSYLLKSDNDRLIILPGALIKFTDDNNDDVREKELVFIADTSCSTHGFTRLLVPLKAGSKQDLSAFTINSFLSSKLYVENISFFLNSVVGTVVPHAVEWFPVIWKPNSVSGPSFHQETETPNVETDTVHAIKCQKWPVDANEWFTRHRQFLWPSDKLIKRIKESTCFVIPDSKHGPLEWRIIFPYAERELLWSFNDVQIQCYTLLKLFKNKYFSVVAPGEINSFLLKMIMFWMSEETPKEIWREDNLFAVTLKCMQKLRHCIERNDLPHYFLRHRNTLLHKLKEESIKKLLLAKIKDVEINLVSAVENCINSAPNASHFGSEIMERIGDKKAIESAFKFGPSMQFDIGLIRLMTHLCLSEQPKEGMISLCNTVDKMRENTSYTEEKFLMFVRQFANIKIGSSLLTEAIYEEDYVKRSQLLAEAEQDFETGRVIDKMAGPLYLASFHLSCGNYCEAKTIIEALLDNNNTFFYPGSCSLEHGISIRENVAKIITYPVFEFQENNTALHVTFLSSDIPLVPDAVKYECCILASDEYSMSMGCVIHPLVYTLLLRFVIYNELDDPKTPKCLKELENAVRDCKGGTRVWIALNILGHCYLKVGRLAEAFSTFVQSFKELSTTKNAALYHVCVCIFYCLTKRDGKFET